MSRQLIRLLTLLALLLAPAGMMGAHAAVSATPSPMAAMSDCAGMETRGHEAPDGAAPASSIDCIIACACVPAEPAGVPAAPLVLAGLAPLPRGSVLPHSLNPAADPPPPRFS